jgi:SAM-dependent methyltransferase
VAKYDTIGRTYTRTRRGEPRIAARIADALGDASTVVNVGAGAGSYEPHDRFVVGVDPSATMLAQRTADAAPAVRAVAERLPFADAAFDAAMATLTLHHWTDVARGLAELRRIAPRQVVFFFEPGCDRDYWLVADYYERYLGLPVEYDAPGTDAIAAALDVRSVEPVLVPADCVDGFGGAFWNRPERYLDADVQAGISSFAKTSDAQRRAFNDALRHDLDSGAWDAKHGHLRRLAEIDLGYRLLVAGS